MIYNILILAAYYAACCLIMRASIGQLLVAVVVMGIVLISLIRKW